MSGNDELIWWEKTVEYAFVIECSEGLAAAPLDGNEESSFADIVIKKGGKFSLIEFKRNKECIKSEENKYENYEKAKKELEYASKDCHYLVYGQNGKKDFLKVQGYFSDDDVEIKSLLTKGVLYDVFNEYLEKLKTYKKSGNDGEGRSGNNLPSVAYVYSIKDKEGNNKAMILNESEVLNLDHDLSLRKNNIEMYKNSDQDMEKNTYPTP